MRHDIIIKRRSTWSLFQRRCMICGCYFSRERMETISISPPGRIGLPTSGAFAMIAPGGRYHFCCECSRKHLTAEYFARVQSQRDDIILDASLYDRQTDHESGGERGGGG